MEDDPGKMKGPRLHGVVTDEWPGGPWTSHGHSIMGLTVAGTDRPPNAARCGGPGFCTQCSKEAEELRRQYAVPLVITGPEASVEELAAAVERWRKNPGIFTTIPADDGPRLGMATTEELYRELIARGRCGGHLDPEGSRATDRALALAEQLGSLSAPEREYRTVSHG